MGVLTGPNGTRGGFGWANWGCFGGAATPTKFNGTFNGGTFGSGLFGAGAILAKPGCKKIKFRQWCRNGGYSSLINENRDIEILNILSANLNTNGAEPGRQPVLDRSPKWARCGVQAEIKISLKLTLFIITVKRIGRAP